MVKVGEYQRPGPIDSHAVARVEAVDCPEVVAPGRADSSIWWDPRSPSGPNPNEGWPGRAFVMCTVSEDPAGAHPGVGTD
jgi:hypothetical protein